MALKLSEQKNARIVGDTDEQPSGNLIDRIAQNPIVNAASNAGVGLGASIGKTGIGLGQAFLKGVGGLANTMSPGAGELVNPIIEQAEKIKRSVYEDPFKKRLETTSGKAGTFLGETAAFIAPTRGITAGQTIASNLLSKAPAFTGKGALNIAARAIPEAVGTAAIELGRTGGDVDSAKSAAALAGGFSMVLGALGGLARATYYPELQGSVTKALGIQGKSSGGATLKDIGRKVAGLSVIKKYAPEVDVPYLDGTVKKFDPANADYASTLSAWNATREAIFKKYSDLAKKSGKNATADLTPIIESIVRTTDEPRLSQFHRAAATLFDDITKNFPDHKNADIERLQVFLKDLNSTTGDAFYRGLSDKASAEINAGTARKLSELMDEVITSSAGPGYAELRGEYSALKSIEDDLVRKFKQEARSIGGGITDYMNIFSSGEIIGGLISANPTLIASGAAKSGLATLRRLLTRPDRFLQRAFSLIDQKVTDPLTYRLFGGLRGVELTPAEEALEQGLLKMASADATERGFARLDLGATGKKKINDPVESFNGFTDLSTKLLEKLKGRTTVSRQYIEDLSNSPDLKQPERDLIRRVLGEDSGETFYRGEGGSDIAQGKALFANGRHFAMDSEYPKRFGEVKAYTAKPDAKVFDASGLDFPEIRAKLGLPKSNYLSTAEYTKALKENGYDILKYDGTYQSTGKPFVHIVEITDGSLIPKSDQISVPDFANKVKSELLPLKVQDSDIYKGTSKSFYDGSEMISEGNFTPKYENIALPPELRGKVQSYRENIYESPISTSAGDVHFNYQTKNYFAHSRIEDLPKNTGTRRVIELQSDLFQKGRLEGEIEPIRQKVASLGKPIFTKDGVDLRDISSLKPGDKIKPKESRQEEFTVKRVTDAENGMVEVSGTSWGDMVVNVFRSDGGGGGSLAKEATEAQAKLVAREAELSKLEPYRNTWHERVIREEVKQAAIDGKTKLQFPTGETAMKIEGLGANSDNWVTPANSRITNPDSLKVGQTIGRPGEDWWVVTDVLGDGKFKAIPKSSYDTYQRSIASGKTGHTLEDIANSADNETFDISGKVDTNNPIYKFYEKEVGKYLKNKYGAELITDAQGVKWWEMKVTPEMKKLPIEAFGAGAIGLGASQKTNQSENPNSIKQMPGRSESYDIEAIKNAISANETSTEDEPYSFSKPSGSKSLGKDLGKYQVTEGELRSYGKRFLGRIPTPKEFLASPELQERYMDNKIQFLLEEGVPLKGIYALHAEGMSGWGDISIVRNKIKSANKERANYVEDAFSLYGTKQQLAERNEKPETN